MRTSRPHAAQFHIPLTFEDRQTAVELQAMLADLVDLTLIGKQAHWNVISRIPCRLRAARRARRRVARWPTTWPSAQSRSEPCPNGQAVPVAGATEFDALPAGHLERDRVIVAMSHRSQASRGARANGSLRSARMP